MNRPRMPSRVTSFDVMDLKDIKRIIVGSTAAETESGLTVGPAGTFP